MAAPKPFPQVFLLENPLGCPAIPAKDGRSREFADQVFDEPGWSERCVWGIELEAAFAVRPIECVIDFTFSGVEKGAHGIGRKTEGKGSASSVQTAA